MYLEYSLLLYDKMCFYEDSSISWCTLLMSIVLISTNGRMISVWLNACVHSFFQVCFGHFCLYWMSYGGDRGKTCNKGPWTDLNQVCWDHMVRVLNAKATRMPVHCFHDKRNM